MLIEVKVKVSRVINYKTHKRTETYLLDQDFFTEAEYAVMSLLNSQLESKEVNTFCIQSLRLSPIKEIAEQFNGNNLYVIVLKDYYHDDNGKEKFLRYKVLLRADDLNKATSNAKLFQAQGYQMEVESVKEVDWKILKVNPEDNVDR